MVGSENRPEVIKYVRMQEINLEQCDVAYIQQWIMGVMNMRKIAVEEIRNDIRRYFV